MRLLDGHTVFITGAARGQGRAHAIASAQQGANVVLFDSVQQISSVGYPMAAPDDLNRTLEEVEALGAKAFSFVGDVRSEVALNQAVDDAIELFGAVDSLIANAGIWTCGSFWELSDDSWQDMLDVCLTGVWRSAKAVAPHMIERQRGSIVITSSVDGLEAGGAYAHYTAAKHGVLGLMKSIALELGPHGVRCNAIVPGAVDTPMLDNQPGYDAISGGSGGTRADLIEGGHRFTVLKQTNLLEPTDIANTALFLNSSLAQRITGAIVPVDAGHMLLSGYNHNPVR
jgi:SDR family mycofactocin-dependent oxidoreductase